MERYRKVINKINGKTGYISLNEFINHGLGLLEFIELEWTYYPQKGYEII